MSDEDQPMPDVVPTVTADSEANESTDAAAATTTAESEPQQQSADDSAAAAAVDEPAGDADEAVTTFANEEDAAAAAISAGEAAATAEEETAQEEVPSAADDDAAAASASAGGDDGDDDGDGAGATHTPVDISSADPDLVKSIRDSLRRILASYNIHTIGGVGVKNIMKALKNDVGKKVVKQNKELAKELAKEAAQARLDEVNAETGDADGDAEMPEETAEEEPAAEEEEEVARPSIMDEEEDEDEEEEKAKKKGKKRLRKAAGSEDDDGDYDEKRPTKKTKKESSKSSAKTKKPASATSALLAIPMPKSSFHIFQQSERPKMKEEHSGANGSEISKLILEKWNALDADSKNEYEQIAQKQKSAYKEALAKLKVSDPEAYESHLIASKRGEEDGGGKKKKAKASSAGSDYDDDPDDGREDANGELTELSYFDSIVRDLKVKRQVKSELGDEEQKTLCAGFINRMEEAVNADINSITKGEPAIARLKMLSDVQAQVSKSRIAQMLIDEGLLRVLTRWISPEPDGSLPNVRLRTVIYQLLGMLNIAEENLSNSRGLGKRVMKLWKDPEETLANKKILETLIQKWMRPMLGLSTNYGMLGQVDHERKGEILTRKGSLDKIKGPLNYNTKRTFVPQAARFDYAIRPQANMDKEEQDEEAMEAQRAKANEPESHKVMLQKRMEKMKRAGANTKAKFKVDITGRQSHL